jgi:hypothetical protein
MLEVAKRLQHPKFHFNSQLHLSLQWRKFNFFDLKPHEDEEIVTKVVGVSFNILRFPIFNSSSQDADIVSSTCGNNQIILGDSNGYIHVFPKNFRESYSFKSHTAVSFCELSIQNNLLITLGVSGDQNSLIASINPHFFSDR